MKTYDLVVIGTGSAGTTAATECARAGRRVAIVDKLPFGGTCVLRGCDPKKILVGASELADWAGRMHEAGVMRNALEIDWPALIRFKRQFTDPAPETRERELSQAGVDAFHGAAQFVAKRALRIDGEEIQAEHVLIAAGARPMTLNVPGEDLLKTSTDFLALEALPKRILFVGGGFIAFEFAHVAARAGAQVHIVEQAPRLLHGFDPDLVDRLVQATRELGIEVSVDTKATAFERRQGGVSVRAQRANQEETFTADIAVHGGGRVPDLEYLQLDAAGIERTKKGVKVNEFMQSVSNPAIYAAGDAADGGGLALTPVAAMEGEVAAYNVLHGNQRRVEFSGLVSAVYTTPPLTSVGLSEEAARDQKLSFDVHSSDMAEWYSSRRIAAKHAAFKVLVERETGRVIGAHVLGPHSEEIANIFSLAISANIPARVLKDALFAYPTGASDIAYML
jgi:glutathione reductase (NADPH)